MAAERQWPPFRKNWLEFLEAVKDFPVRSSDIFVISSPKSGHHWSYEFLSMMLSGAELSSWKPSDECKEDFFLEFPRNREDELDMTSWELEASPRLIMTHLPVEFLPSGVFTVKPRVGR